MADVPVPPLVAPSPKRRRGRPRFEDHYTLGKCHHQRSAEEIANQSCNRCSSNASKRNSRKQPCESSDEPRVARPIFVDFMRFFLVDDEDYRYFLGVPKEFFDSLYGLLEEKLMSAMSGVSPLKKKPKLEYRAHLAMTLFYLRQAVSKYVVGRLFGLSTTACTNRMNHVLKCINEVMVCRRMPKSEAEITALISLAPKLDNVIGYVDGTESPRNRVIREERRWHSGKLRMSSMMTLLVVGTDGLPMFIETGFEGHNNDMGMYQESELIGIMENLNKNFVTCNLLGDKGFVSQKFIDAAPRGVRADDPVKGEEVHNKAHHRVAIENMIAIFKKFKITDRKFKGPPEAQTLVLNAVSRIVFGLATQYPIRATERSEKEAATLQSKRVRVKSVKEERNTEKEEKRKQEEEARMEKLKQEEAKRLEELKTDKVLECIENFRPNHTAVLVWKVYEMEKRVSGKEWLNDNDIHSVMQVALLDGHIVDVSVSRDIIQLGLYDISDILRCEDMEQVSQLRRPGATQELMDAVRLVKKLERVFAPHTDITKYSRVYIPCHHRNHYFIAELVPSKNVVYYFDSLGHKSFAQHGDMFHKNLSMIWKLIYKKDLAQQIVKKGVAQKNQFNCGAFILLFFYLRQQGYEATSLTCLENKHGMAFRRRLETLLRGVVTEETLEGDVLIKFEQ